jgi:DNA-binding FadR family transcriptional regulator
MEREKVRQNLCGQVVHDLGYRIVRGDLKPGDALPQEPNLCEELGVSRTVVREAVKMLSAKGLVDSRPKRGTVVRPSKTWNFLDAEVLQWRSEADPDGQHLTYLTELRQTVEPAAAAMAASRASDEEVALIAEACDAMEKSVESVEEFLDADLQFHVEVLHASGNPFFAPVVNVVNSALLSSLRVTNRKPADNVTSVPVHQRVLKAIRARDPDKAEAAMKALLSDAAIRIEKNATRGKKRGAR